MTSRSRRKHRITVPNLPRRNRPDRGGWRTAAGLAARTVLAGLLAAALDCPSELSADELGLPPGVAPPATLNVADDIRPIGQPDIESFRVQVPPSAVTRSPKQSTAQWSVGNAKVVAESETAWKLRWRQPPAMARTITADPQPLMASRAAVWNQPAGRTAGYPVRTAAQLEPADPFEEPYSSQPAAGQAPSPTTPLPGGDRALPPQPAAPDPFRDPADTMPAPQPRGLDSPPVESPPAEISPAPQPSVPPPGVPQPTVPRDERDLPPMPPPNLGMPDPSTAPGPNDLPCDRIYNNRNCCSDEAKCKLAHDYVTQHKITNILLDITPSFTNPDGAIPTDVRKESDLAKAPARVWKDRAGNVLGEGSFKDYRNGMVHIVGDDSETRQLAFNELSNDDVCFVTAWWSLPTECSLTPEPYQPRNWLASTFTWKASALCHKPLYFEEVALERYGHSVGPLKQPFVSGAHFFGSLMALPYQMGIHPPNECQYALGYYRPGSCAPWLVPPFPVSVRAAAAAAGAYVGGVYIIP